MEEIIPLTPIPQPAGRIQGRELDLLTEIISSSDGIFAYVINSESSTVNQITISSNEIGRLRPVQRRPKPQRLDCAPINRQVIVANSFVKLSNWVHLKMTPSHYARIIGSVSGISSG